MANQNHDSSEAVLSSSDGVDEELAALAPPPPDAAQAIFIGVILAFSVLVLVLFWPEMRYFLKVFSAPLEVGEAADFTGSDVESDTYLAIDGVPLINRAVTFRIGTKWFSGDIYRKMAPLSGNPNLLVQWSIPNPAIAQAEKTISPPSFFAGRLKKRADLSESYQKFWPFYDCLKWHDTSECKYCIGKTGIDECRPIFTCVNRYPMEVCDLVAFSDVASVDEELARLSASLDNNRDQSATLERLAILRQAKGAFSDLPLLTKHVRLEELVTRLFPLTAVKPVAVQAQKLLGQVLDARRDVLLALMGEVSRMVAGFGAMTMKQLAQTDRHLATMDGNLAKVRAAKKGLEPLVNLNRALADYVAVTRHIEQMVAQHDATVTPLLANFELVPAGSGSAMLSSTLQLEADLIKATGKSDEGRNAGRALADTSSDVAKMDRDQLVGDTDSGSTDTDSVHDESALPSTQAPEVQKLLALLDEAKQRISKLGRTIDRLAVGDAPELEHWAKKTDIIGTLPEPLVQERVFKHLKEIEQMVSGITPSATVGLKSRYRALDAQEEEQAATCKKLAATSGLVQFRLMNQVKEMGQLFDSKGSTLQQKQTALDTLETAFVRSGLYPTELEGHPTIRKQLNQLFDRFPLKKMEQQIADLESQVLPAQMVLADGERPGDNLWVLFVFLAVPIMMIVNIRKLWRFFLLAKESR